MNRTALCTALALAGLTAFHAPAAAAAATPAEVSQLDMARVNQMAAQNVFRVHAPTPAMGRKAAISFHHAVLESRWSEGYQIMELSDEEVGKLRALKFRVEPDAEYVAKRDAIISRLRAAGVTQLLGQEGARQYKAAGLDAQPESIPGYACYETVEETYAAGQGFTTQYPDLATWTPIGVSWKKSKDATKGYDIFALKLTSKKTTTSFNGKPKPKLFINAAIHAREYVTAPLALAFARELLQGYGKNADATWLLDRHEIHMVLQTNPDGRKEAEGQWSWRKNVNPEGCTVDPGAIRGPGVDLNRNFTFTWNQTNGQGSSSDPCLPDYRGKSPGSEPETQAIEKYVRSIFPDRRGPNRNDPAPADTTGMHIDLHSYSQLVLWPWGDEKTPSGNAAQFQTLGRKFAFFNGYYPQQSIGLYPTDGTSDSVSYGELGVPHYTFELGTEFFQACQVFQKKIKPTNLKALWYAAKVVGAPYVTPAGPDVTELALDQNAATKGVKAGTAVKLTAKVDDTRYSTANGNEASQNVAGAEIYVQPMAQGTLGTPLAAQAADGAFNSSAEGITATLTTTGMKPGRYLVYVRGKDAAGNLGAFSASFLKITK